MGDRLKYILNKRGMSRDELAKRTGYHINTIERIINHPERDVYVNTIIAIAKALNVSVDYLLGLV